MHRAFCFHFTAARQGSSMASVPVFCRDFWAERKKAPGGVERLKMASACALAIFSGRIIFISRLSRSAERSKRIFTGGVATVSGIYRKQDRKKPRRAGALRGTMLILSGLGVVEVLDLNSHCNVGAIFVRPDDNGCLRPSAVSIEVDLCAGVLDADVLIDEV